MHRPGRRGMAGSRPWRWPAISMRWLMVCSAPEEGAVVPAAPIVTPLSVRIWAMHSIASGSRSASRAAARSKSGPQSRTIATSRGEYPEPMFRRVARCQSAGAVNMAIRSPTPAALSRAGAPDSTSTSATSASGHRVGTVRLTLSTISTDWSSAKPLTLSAVCTITCGRPPRRCDTALPMSASVPEPTVTRARDPGHLPRCGLDRRRFRMSAPVMRGNGHQADRIAGREQPAQPRRAGRCLGTQDARSRRAWPPPRRR